MDIKNLTIQELKSLAYDTLVLIQNSQANLGVINNEIALRQKEVKEVKEEKEIKAK